MSTKKNHRISNVIWERPINYTRGILAIPIPPEPDAPVPLYWLDNRNGELFFVNASNETLIKVSAELGGYETCDDDVLSVSNGSGYTYHDVKPQEAIQIEKFIAQADSDFIFQMYIEINSPSRGKQRISTPSEKGKISGQIILFDDGSWGKHIQVLNPLDNE
jgi:hypothetical protein